MVRNAEQTASMAEADRTNVPGYCLQQSRGWADIGALHRTAAIAWMYATDKHYGRSVPRGAFAYWTGGSKGYGHIAVGLGNGLIRSTDAGGSGIVATRTLDWFDQNWGGGQDGLHYAGWADNVNGVTVPGVEDDEMNDADFARIRLIVQEEIAQGTTDLPDKTQNAVWNRIMAVENLQGETVKKEVSRLVRDIWEKTRSIVKP